MKDRSGAQVLVDALKVHGVDTAFCVPGESYLAVLDALYDAREEIKLVVARQDGGAAYMAEAYAKLTGKPGICFVTRGPGATNASIAIHTAFQDSTPMILFIGQVGSDFSGREAFQEIDYRSMFGQMAKWVASVDRADRMPELISRAFHCAMAGRRGPVVLALPEDMLTTTVAVPDADPYKVVQPSPAAADIKRLRDMLAAAERPFVILGGTGWDAAACADLRRFAEANELPIGCAFRFLDLFDNRHASYAGDVGIGINPRLAQRIKEADVVFALGPRLGEITTSGYTLLVPPRPAQRLIHVHPGAEELGRVYQTDLPINAGMREIAAALAAMAPVDAARWRSHTQAANADYRVWSAQRENAGPVQMWPIFDWLKRRLPEDAVLANGAGNFAGWLHRYYQYPGYKTLLGPTSGAMGYGVPAGVAAKIAAPHRMVLSFNGDGDFLMNGQEIATAVQYDAAVIFIVVNNGMYGTIRMHQERAYPGRVYGTDLQNPDFAALARAFGAHGERVAETSEFAPAFERSVAAAKPALIEILLDRQAITTQATIDQLRAQKR